MTTDRQPTTLDNLTALLPMLTGNKGSTTDTTKVSQEGISALVKKALEDNAGLANVSNGQHAAGMYNSTVNTQLTNDLLSRVGGEASSRTSSKTQSVNNPGLLSGNSGLLMAALGGYKQLGGTKGIKDMLGFGSDLSSSDIGGSVNEYLPDFSNGESFMGGAQDFQAGDYSNAVDFNFDSGSSFSSAPDFFGDNPNWYSNDVSNMVEDTSNYVDSFEDGTSVQEIRDLLFARGGKVPEKPTIARLHSAAPSSPAGTISSGQSAPTPSPSYSYTGTTGSMLSLALSALNIGKSVLAPSPTAVLGLAKGIKNFNENVADLSLTDPSFTVSRDGQQVDALSYQNNNNGVTSATTAEQASLNAAGANGDYGGKNDGESTGGFSADSQGYSNGNYSGPSNSNGGAAYATGGRLPGHDTAGKDNVLAKIKGAAQPNVRLSGGEYIIPTATVDHYGEAFFDNLLAKTAPLVESKLKKGTR